MQDGDCPENFVSTKMGLSPLTVRLLTSQTNIIPKRAFRRKTESVVMPHRPGIDRYMLPSRRPPFTRTADGDSPRERLPIFVLLFAN